MHFQFDSLWSVTTYDIIFLLLSPGILLVARGTPKIFRYTGKILPVASLLQSAFSVSISGQH